MLLIDNLGIRKVHMDSVLEWKMQSFTIQKEHQIIYRLLSTHFEDRPQNYWGNISTDWGIFLKILDFIA